jgi:probable F420-dependent oxidoreductase
MPGLKVGFIPIEGGHFYRQALEEVVRGEDLGFDSVWMEEHHSVVDHYWPSPLPVLAGFATRTSKVILGTDILVAPFYHPVRLAEDVALLDVMSGGRAVLGVAIGYKPDEFALYGADLEKRGARFEEQLAIVKGLWTQERLSFKGTYYQLEGSLEPKPIAKPHPPIWIGGWGELTLRRAATLADNWIPGPTADLARLLDGKKRFLANRQAARLRSRSPSGRSRAT